MNLSTYCETFVRRHLAPAGIAAAAIMAVVVGASPPPARAATMIDKSRYAEIGTGATRLVVHVNRGLNATTNRYSTYATTKAATINAIVQHVNALPKAPSVDEMCPMDVGAKLTLDFYRRSSTPYAIVAADPGGCGVVTIRAYNANDALKGSAAVGGGAAFSMYVATQLHISSLQTF
jgi:hypothetical protein